MYTPKKLKMMTVFGKRENITRFEAMSKVILRYLLLL